MINQSDQFLGSMGYCNIIVFTLGSFLCKICIEFRISMTNIYGGVKQSIPKIFGTFFYI